ncbi:CorA family divalent cation transporter [Methanococcus voltae]|uniref:Uncharacterized protein n=1 Tax=Methanococcus voltae (strain ATCC BAA-1334 / A3) TaxID=456320 RepID=D7DST6_METV3|nr:CorA family divalent cation transporter [Methanococcus voltae]MCS3901797.1 hypothetical protein [Methanococcus voltae]
MNKDKNSIKEPVSKHIFMLPFKWNLTDVTGKIYNNYDEKLDVHKLTNILKNDDNWKFDDYKVNEPLKYNEFVYFYNNVRKAIFGKGVEDLNEENDKYKDNENKLLEKYLKKEYPVIRYKNPNFKNKDYTFKLYKKDEDTKNDTENLYFNELEYKLNIDKIYLNIYNTGVGILSIHLSNYDYSEKEDIININDYGRRIYPQFLGLLDKQIYVNENLCENNILKGPKTKFLANLIKISSLNPENFEEYNSITKSTEGLQNPVKLAKPIMDLLGTSFDTIGNCNSESICIEPIIDDRMFTMCWYGNNDLVNYLDDSKNAKNSENKNLLNYNNNNFNNNYNHEYNTRTDYNYESNEYWHRFMFMDSGGSCTCQNEKLLTELNKKHTYTRWSNYGTLYGVTRYSFALLTTEYCDNNKFLVNHFKTMYFEMVQLCLAQRASILKFSEDISQNSKNGINGKGLEGKGLTNYLNNVRSLYGRYINFLNCMYFNEVSAQEQGIEMYDLIQDRMNIAQNLKDLDNELNELHQYVTLIESNKTSEKINLLAILGALFIVPTFFTGFFGMNLTMFTGASTAINQNGLTPLFSMDSSNVFFTMLYNAEFLLWIFNFIILPFVLLYILWHIHYYCQVSIKKLREYMLLSIVILIITGFLGINFGLLSYITGYIGNNSILYLIVEIIYIILIFIISIVLINMPGLKSIITYIKSIFKTINKKNICKKIRKLFNEY